MDTNETIRDLRRTGHDAQPVDARTIRIDGVDTTIAKTRSIPTPSDIDRAARANPGRPLLFIADGPVSDKVRRRVLDLDRASLVAEELVIVAGTTSRIVEPEPAPQRPRGRKPYAQAAVARVLLTRGPHEWTQLELAKHAGTTQPSASTAAKKFSNLLAHGTLRLVKPFALADWFTAAYPGPGGVSTYWWSDQPLRDQAATLWDAGAVISGDIAAEQHYAWRQPEHVVAYTRDGIDMASLGFVSATPDDYTAALIHPDDRTIFATADGQYADLWITAFDVTRTGTSGDHDEQARVLIEHALNTTWAEPDA